MRTILKVLAGALGVFIAADSVAYNCDRRRSLGVSYCLKCRGSDLETQAWKFQDWGWGCQSCLFERCGDVSPDRLFGQSLAPVDLSKQCAMDDNTLAKLNGPIHRILITDQLLLEIATHNVSVAQVLAGSRFIEHHGSDDAFATSMFPGLPSADKFPLWLRGELSMQDYIRSAVISDKFVVLVVPEVQTGSVKYQSFYEYQDGSRISFGDTVLLKLDDTAPRRVVGDGKLAPFETLVFGAVGATYEPVL